MVKPQELKSAGRVTMAIFGPPKIGKTELAGTFPATAFLDFDFGITTVLRKDFVEKWGLPVEVEQIEAETDDRGLYRDTKAFWESIKVVNRWAKRDDIQTIVVDSLTTFSTLAIYAGIEANKARNRSETANIMRKVGMIIMTRADFGAEMNAVNQFMTQIVKVPKNIIVVCHEREDTTDSGIVRRRDPLITGARSRAMFARWFDDVVYLDADRDGKRVLITEPDSILKVVGSRHKIPNKIENPTYEKLKKYFELAI